MKKFVEVEIRESINKSTKRDLAHKGKVYVVEVKAKLKHPTPSWFLVFLIADIFAGMGFTLVYIGPPVVWPVDPLYVFGTLILIAILLIIMILKETKNAQVTDP